MNNRKKQFVFDKLVIKTIILIGHFYLVIILAIIKLYNIEVKLILY